MIRRLTIGYRYWHMQRHRFGWRQVGGEMLCVMDDRNLRGKPRGSARGSSEQAGTACGATSVASGQLACEVQQGQPHQPLPTAMLSGE